MPSLWSVCCINQSLSAIEVASVVMFSCVAGYYVHHVYNSNKITTSRAIVKQFFFLYGGGGGGEQHSKKLTAIKSYFEPICYSFIYQVIYSFSIDLFILLSSYLRCYVNLNVYICRVVMKIPEKFIVSCRKLKHTAE